MFQIRVTTLGFSLVIFLLLCDEDTCADLLTMLAFDKIEYEPPPGGTEYGSHPRDIATTLSGFTISQSVTIIVFANYLLLNTLSKF